MAQPYYNPGTTPFAGGMVRELMDAFERVQSAFEAASDRGIDILDAGALISSDAKILDFRHPLKAVVAGDRTVAVTMNAECGSGEVPATRRINTVFPLRGGGDFSQDRTHSVADASITQKGVVQIAGPGETSDSKVVRADDPRLGGGGGGGATGSGEILFNSSTPLGPVQITLTKAITPTRLMVMQNDLQGGNPPAMVNALVFPYTQQYSGSSVYTHITLTIISAVSGVINGVVTENTFTGSDKVQIGFVAFV